VVEFARPVVVQVAPAAARHEVGDAALRLMRSYRCSWPEKTTLTRLRTSADSSAGRITSRLSAACCPDEYSGWWKNAIRHFVPASANAVSSHLICSGSPGWLLLSAANRALPSSNE